MGRICRQAYRLVVDISSRATQIPRVLLLTPMQEEHRDAVLAVVVCVQTAYGGTELATWVLSAVRRHRSYPIMISTACLPGQIRGKPSQMASWHD